MFVEHLSASRIKTFQQCQLQYHATYELGIPEGDPHPLTIMGTGIHKVFERGVGAYLRADDDIPDLEHHIRADVIPVCSEIGVTRANTTLAAELVDNAIAWGYLRNLKRCDGVEVKFDEVLPDGTKVTGFIDRLDLDIPKADVIDLKTQGKAFEETALADEWQSVVYNWAVRRIRPFVKGQVTLSYWVLRHRVQRCWMSADDAKSGEDKLLAIADEIKSCTDPQPSPSALCQWCPYKEQCTASS